MERWNKETCRNSHRLFRIIGPRKRSIWGSDFRFLEDCDESRSIFKKELFGICSNWSQWIEPFFRRRDCEGDYTVDITLHLTLGLRIWIRDSESILHKEKINDPDPHSGGEKEWGGASWLLLLLRPCPQQWHRKFLGECWLRFDTTRCHLD